jgi:hypothetical protein
VAAHPVSSCGLEAEPEALEDLEEAHLHAARELQAAGTLKAAQVKFNSARQISLQSKMNYRAN